MQLVLNIIIIKLPISQHLKPDKITKFQFRFTMSVFSAKFI